MSESNTVIHRDVLVESDTDNDDDDFHDCNSNDTTVTDDRWLLGQVDFESDIRINSHVSARLFVNNIQNFTFNRMLQHTQVTNLVESIRQTGYVLGTISLALDTNNNLRILDGQHRVKALQQLLADNANLDFTLHLTSYRVPRLNSRETLDLFLGLNNSLNLVENPVLENVHSLVTKLQSLFPLAIVDHPVIKKNGHVPRCQRPKVDTRRLKERLEVNLLNHFTTPLNTDRFLNLILTKNASYGTRSVRELFGNQRRQSVTRFTKAQRNGGWFLTMRDMDRLPDNAHKDENGNLLFDDQWIVDIIQEYQQSDRSESIS